MGCFRFGVALFCTLSIIISVNASEGSVVSRADGSNWQSVKDKLQITVERIAHFFTNDIPHFFKKDVSEKHSKFKKVAEEDATDEKEELNNIVQDLQKQIKSIKVADACQCVNYSCGCCQHLEEPSIHLNSTLCANITYLSEDIGLSMTVTVNDYAIFNETVSVRNPPPVCLGVPYVKEFADACFRLYDIDATRTHFHACAQVEARMKHILIAKYDLGCFDIGPFHTTSNTHEQKSSQIQEPSVMLI